MTINESSTKQTPDSLRQRVVQKYREGFGPSKIAADLSMNVKTVTQIINIYKRTGRINAIKVRQPKVKKIKNEAKELIENEILSDVSITLKSLKMKLNATLGIGVSQTSINNTLKNLCYSFKRVQTVPEPRNTEQTIQSRFIFCNEYLLFDETKIIFLDEFGISCSTRSKYGRSKVNTTPRKGVRAIRSRNFSVIAAISRTQLISFNVQETAYNQITFLQYIDGLIDKLRDLNFTGCKVIMDNASIHKASEVRERLQNSGHALIFLPPYSPQLNAIEETFSKWKTLIKSRNCMTTDELYEAIDDTHENITQSDCEGFFRHIREFAVKGIQREEF